MKRLHLTMMLVVLVAVAIFLGHLFGGRQGAWMGAAAAAGLAGVFLWKIAPAECDRQIAIIERSGARLTNPHAFRKRFLKGARLPAAALVAIGLATLLYLLLRSG